MKIFIVGPQHSGKSVFLNHLINLLPTERIRRVEACPDGEGLWSTSPNAKEVELVRQKGEHSDAYVQNTIKRIRLCDERIAIIDVGGKLNGGDKVKAGEIDRIEENNKLVFSEGDAVIIVSGNPEQMREWEDFCTQKVISHNTGKPLTCIAKIDTFDPDNLEYADEKSSILEPEGDVLRAKIYGLKRSQKLTNDQRLVFKQIIKKLLEITKAEARTLPHYDVDGYDLAEKAGIVKYIGEDPTPYCRQILFPRDRTALIYEAVKQMDFESQMETGEPVTIGNINNGRVTVAVCDALRKWKSKTGKVGLENIELFDEIAKKTVPIKQIEELEESDAHFCLLRDSMLAMYKIESLGASFLNIEVYGDVLSERDYLESFKMPRLDEHKVLYVSGRMPHYLLASICTSSEVKTIYTFTPGAGFTCVKHDSEIEEPAGKRTHWVGRKIADIKEVEDLEGINITGFFLDRKRDDKSSGMDYVLKDHFNQDELEELEALNIPNNVIGNRNRKSSHSKKKNKPNDPKIKAKIVSGELKSFELQSKSRQAMILQMQSNSHKNRAVNLKAAKQAVKKDEMKRKKR